MVKAFAALIKLPLKKPSVYDYILTHMWKFLGTLMQEVGMCHKSQFLWKGGEEDRQESNDECFPGNWDIFKE